MDRREVLKALLALPAVKSIEVADLKRGDVIVIESAEYLWQQYTCRINRRGPE